MVQYFRNYIVRPTLSATSTVDSLSSSFICNANEANTLIPPPYSRAGSPLPMNIQDYSSVPRSASQQISSMEQMQNQRSIPVLVTNSSNRDGEQITLYRHYHDFTNETTTTTADIDDNSFVHFQRTPNSVSFQRLHDNNINDIAHNENPTNVSHPINNFNNANENSISSSKKLTNNNNFNNDIRDRNPSDILSKQCDVIDQTISNNSTIAQESNSNNSSTNAKPKLMQNSFSYNNHSTNGFFDSYDSIDDERNFTLNLPIASQTITPSAISIDRGFDDFNVIRNKNRTENYAVINERKQLDKSSSLPFSEESPVNAELLKKYGMSMREFTDSMSGSAVSSLANYDYPTSPPQATTPTGEIRELLEQIRQLQENANSGKKNFHSFFCFLSNQIHSFISLSLEFTIAGSIDDYAKHDVQSGAATTISNESSSYCNAEEYDGDESSTSNGTNKLQQSIKRPSSFEQNRRSQQRTRFFPTAKNLRSPIGNSNLLGFTRNRKGWISKSAPTTPGTTIPSLCLNDDSPLLNVHDEDDEQNT